ncbi:MAG: ribosome-associated translation inhibitor RaiA [Deltaproteobacteria bacterium]|nr:ribosome-associated translation inhibitor RaiA [Deltaproteobacteria bacterium]
MKITVTFRHVDSSDHIRQYAEDKLSRLDKFLDSAAEAHVVLSVEKFRHTADISLSANGLRIKGVEETEDMYSAIDTVVDKIERQMRRQLAKRKVRKNQQGGLKSLSFRMNVVDPESVEEGEKPALIRTKQIQAKPMDVEEAIMQLDLINNDFLVFTNAQSKTVNVVYRRKDGQLGIIEPA